MEKIENAMKTEKTEAIENVKEKVHDKDKAAHEEGNILLKDLSRPLLLWYDKAKRELPWRENTDPYRVWVSEIMLQQTRVEAVTEGYIRFLSALPDLKSLAEAPEELLMKLWEGMGYYSRARNMQKAAKIALERWGSLPASLEELRSLPGIGEYTAGAVASIAFGIPAAAVDGNVLRVLSRLLNSFRDVTEPAAKREAEALLLPIIPKNRAGDFTQALMELGALVCIPGRPKCGECPVSSYCLGFKAGTAGALPVKKKNKARKVEERTVFLLLDEEKRLALEKRPDKGLLAGMWQLPNREGFFTPEESRDFWEKSGFRAEKVFALPKAAHVFSHVEWRMTGVALLGKAETQETKAGEKEREAFEAVKTVSGPVSETGFHWASREELEKEKALPSAFRAYKEAYAFLYDCLNDFSGSSYSGFTEIPTESLTENLTEKLAKELSKELDKKLEKRLIEHLTKNLTKGLGKRPAKRRKEPEDIPDQLMLEGVKQERSKG